MLKNQSGSPPPKKKKEGKWSHISYIDSSYYKILVNKSCVTFFHSVNFYFGMQIEQICKFK